MARALARKITRKQALSYDRTSPNGMGVTAIASVNGRRAYARRYAQTKAILSQGAKSMLRRRAKRNYTAKEMNDLHDAQMRAARKAKRAKRRTAAATAAAPAAPARKPRRKPARKVSAKRRKHPKTGKRYGKFKSTVAKVGIRRLRTFATARRGKIAKIPVWAIIGAKSAKAAKGDKFAKKLSAVAKRREKRAASVLKHGDLFTPNRRRKSRKSKVIPFATWSKSMRPNKYRRGKKGKLRGARLAAWKRKHPALVKSWGKKTRRVSSKRRAAPKRRRAAGKRRVHARKRKHTTTVRRAAPKRRRAAPKRRRAAGKRRVHARKRKHTRRAAPKRRVARKTRARRALRTLKRYVGNRRRRARRNEGVAVAATPNRRRRHVRKHSRRPSYRRNFKSELMSALKTGAPVVGGFLLHRVLTHVATDQLNKATTALGQYTGIVGGGLVAGLGILLLGKAPLAPETKKNLGIGIAASFLHGTIVAISGMIKPEIAGYLGSYPVPGYHGYGAYEVSNAPMRQALAGYGEYMQAAAGMGALPPQALAAGYGRPRLGMGAVMQAAAGTGSYWANPQMRGIGEYYEKRNGAAGMGAYYTEDGIRPDTRSAERALSVAEAVAGLGADEEEGYPGDMNIPEYPNDMGYDDIWDATQMAAPPGDIPDAYRSGVLEGGDGIFS